jgi:hypothetical protein
VEAQLKVRQNTVSDPEPETKQPAASSRSVIDELARETSLKMMAKIRRAFRKAGKESTYEEQRALLKQLLVARIPVLNRGSKRIAKMIKGEGTMGSLSLIRGPKKSEYALSLNPF